MTRDLSQSIYYSKLGTSSMDHLLLLVFWTGT